MSSFAPDRLRPKKADLLVLAVILVAAAALGLALRPRGEGPLTAVVTVDGAEVARRDLERLEGPEQLEIPGLAYPLTVEFDRGRVRVSQAGCPGEDCVHTGWVSRPGGQIVCLPNRLSVTLTGGGAPTVDAVTG